MARERTSVSMYIDIDLAEVLGEMSDKQLIEALETRCIEVARTTEDAKVDSLTPLVEEALQMLRQGRPDDAMLTLERALYPKWDSPEQPLGILRQLEQARVANG